MQARVLFERLEPVFLVLLALVFTAGLMFASVEIPRAVDQLLDRNVTFLDVATGQDAITEYKTEVFLSRYHIRLLGYVCLGLTLALIAAGFVLEKRVLASAGALILFLPVFGHFAATMFFLGGLAFLRFLWLPFLDISFDIMHLGDIVLLPYHWILDAASLVGLNLHTTLPFIITGLGLFVFLVGVLSWSYGKIRRQNVTDFWIYRISRHPQYLGWIIWSYGVLFLPGPNLRQYVEVGNTLPWLLSTMAIVGVALLEERKMKQRYGDDYESYRQRTPFLFPLPRVVRKALSLPLSLLFKRAYPERKREVATVVAFYTALLVLLSAFSSGTIGLRSDGIEPKPPIEQLVHTIKTSHNRGEIRNAASSLADISGPGVDALIHLLDHENMFVRWYSADALGSVRSEKVVLPLAALLDDPEDAVRKAAVSALGGTGSDRAVPILMAIFQHPEKGMRSSAARSLGRLGAVEAVPLLVDGLHSEHSATARACAWALGEVGSGQAVQPLVACLEQRKDCDYYVLGEALRKLGSERAEDAYIAGLGSSTGWVQSHCATALGEFNSQKGLAALTQALQHGEVPVRRAAVLALARYPSPQAESALKESLTDEDWEVRMYAEEALRAEP